MLAGISLLILLASVAIGFFRKMNVGIVALLGAVVLGYGSGQFSDSDIIAGFGSSLFLTLAGITMVFTMVQSNRSLELLIHKIIARIGNFIILVPIIFFIFSWLVSASGPGLIPTAALVAVIAIPVAKVSGYSPVMLAIMGVHAANAGRFTVLTVEGNLINELLGAQGYTESIIFPLCLSVTIIAVILSVIAFIWYKGYKVKYVESDTQIGAEKFTKEQLLTLAGMLVMVLLILVGGLSAGLAAFSVGAVLLFLRVSDEKTVFKNMPWGTILMVVGVGMLMNLVIASGGIDLLSAYLTSIMNPTTASALTCIIAGVMSWFSSTLGVVMPTLLPTVSNIINTVGGDVTVLEIVAAIGFAASSAGLSPASTAGSLILGAVTSDPQYKTQYESDKLFIELFAWAAVSIVIIAAIALTGYFRWFANM